MTCGRNLHFRLLFPDIPLNVQALSVMAERTHESHVVASQQVIGGTTNVSSVLRISSHPSKIRVSDSNGHVVARLAERRCSAS